MLAMTGLVSWVQLENGRAGFVAVKMLTRAARFVATGEPSALAKSRENAALERLGVKKRSGGLRLALKLVVAPYRFDTTTL